MGYKSIALAIQAGAFGAIVASGAAAGFVMGAITTGTLSGALEGAVWGGLSAGLTYGIGHGALGAGLGRFGKAVAHGVAQGAIGSLRGGTFKAGFAGGFLSHAVPVQGGKISGLVQKTVIGGTAAEISGGKFANGAKSAAFVYLFNELGSASQRKLGEVNGIGSRRSFVIRSDDRLRVEPYSHTVGADQFSYDVDYNLITSDGKILSNAKPLNAFGETQGYASPSVTTGLNGGFPDLEFQVNNNYGDWTMWHISIPQQYTTHQNSAGWNLQVYEVR